MSRVPETRAPAPLPLLRAEVERGLQDCFHLVLVNLDVWDAREVEVWVGGVPARGHRAWTGPSVAEQVPGDSSVSYPNCLRLRRKELPVPLSVTWVTPEGRRREFRTDVIV